MKKGFLLLVGLVYFLFGFTQNIESIDFFTKVIYDDNISIKELSSGEVITTVIYYEFSYNNEDPELGEGCIYAVPKSRDNSWVKKAIASPSEECSYEKAKRDVYYKYCFAIQYFKNKEKLSQEFDIYTFSISKEFLEGPYLEASEGGALEYYITKPKSKIRIFKYIKDNWQLIDERDLSKMNPRNFGQLYIEKLLN